MASLFRDHRLYACLLLLVLVVFSPISPTTPVRAAGVIYVNAAATGAADGTSWSNAYPTLQDALGAVSSGSEIWVARGIYYPDEGAAQINNTLTSTFVLTNSVALYGGFAGTETTRTERDITANLTVLSGDLDQNDMWKDPNGVVTSTEGLTGTNAYHVVTAFGLDDAAILDGFTITAGWANGAINSYNRFGGGMHNIGGEPTVTNVTFTANRAEVNGGGMSNYFASPKLSNLTFIANSAGDGGGGMSNYKNFLVLTNITFVANTAKSGGGMLNSSSSPSLINVTFAANSATFDGGGMYNLDDYHSSIRLQNVTFAANSARYGGGMYNNNGHPMLVNVIMAYNTIGGDCAGAITSIYGLFMDSTRTCGIPDGVAGNIVGQDPLLGPLQNNGGGMLTYALLPGSPAINAGINDFCPATDQRGITRPRAGVCDMGAFEYVPTWYLPLVIQP